MIFHDVVQGSQEWHDLRRGRPTASDFKRIITPKKEEFSKGADGYIAELIGQKLSIYYPERAEHYTSKSMKWGAQTEEEARRYLSMELGLDVTNGGFITTDDGRFGCSPDGIIGGDVGLELKCPEEKNHMAWLLKGGLPMEHKCQVHGCLAVTGFAEWIFFSYCAGCPPLLVRVVPDEFTVKLTCALQVFHAKLTAAWAKVKAM